jgi:hypothetical protein
MKSRLVNNVIVEILVPVRGFSIEDCFHSDILRQCVDTPDDAQVGWVLQEDGSYQDAEGNVVYTPPVISEPVEPVIEPTIVVEETTTETPPVTE